MSQLALPLKLDDHAVFATYYAGRNAAVVTALERIADGHKGGCWLWGPAAVGKSHLLQAACERAGDRAVYLPLRALGHAAALAGLDSREIVCLDDVNVVAGDEAFEQALFSLYNTIVSGRQSLIVSATMAPRECPFDLADLASRMTQLAVYHLRELEDDDRAAALKLRASHRGLELPDDTLRYLLTRSRRDMASLYALLDTLDTAALRAQRRLTVPFVRDVLSGARAPTSV